MKQIILVLILATATSTFARLGDTQKEFEKTHPDLKYMGESPGSEPNSVVRQYAREDTVVQILLGANLKVIMEMHANLAGKFAVSSLVPLAKSYGYNFS